MFKFIFNISKISIYSLILKYKKINDKDLDILHRYINDCGCFVIKIIQWIFPILEKELINKKILNVLNNVYEKNYIHDLDYTENKYKKHFNNELKNDYDIIDVIASGSIGQVYKIKCKKTGKLFAMKVKHPNVERQILLIKNMLNIIYNFKIFNNIFYNYFPFNLLEFLEDFYKQTDFINECNNLLCFYNYYKDNEYILVPKLNKSSSDIIILEYIEGTCIEDVNINDHHKSKLIYLLYLFVRNNILISNINHGDLHKYNWKVSNEKINNMYKIIIYDFGYCFSLDEIEHSNIQNLCDLLSNLGLKNDIYKQKYSNFLKFIFNDNNIILDSNFNCKITDPDVLLDEVLKISKKYKKTIYRFKLLNAILLLNLVDKYFKKYNINNNDNHYIVKKNILDAYTFCNTYKIFPGLEKHLLDEYKLDYKLPKQSIQFSDKIKSLI